MKKYKSDTGQSLFNQFKAVSKAVDTSNLSSADIISLRESGIDLSELTPVQKRGPKPSLTPEQEVLVLKLVSSGFSVASIAIQFNVSESVIYAIKKRHGLAK